MNKTNMFEDLKIILNGLEEVFRKNLEPKGFEIIRDKSENGMHLGRDLVQHEPSGIVRFRQPGQRLVMMVFRFTHTKVLKQLLLIL